jgi:hypothetical protein
MPQKIRHAFALAVVAAAIPFLGIAAHSQTMTPTNSLPNPYRSIDNWAKMPDGRIWGSTSAVDIDPDGTSVWVAERCGAQGFIKFSPDGRLLMTLGKAGVAGSGPDAFNAPSSVFVAPNGNIFVGDGHGGDTNARIMKFSPDGKLIKTWGKQGSAPGDIDIPHALAMDSQGRLFVGDRNNNRIQIFDQDGNFIAEWKQFSHPSGVFIDRNDTIYVADSESESVRNSNPGWRRGIRVGSARTGEVTALIPDPVEKITGTSAAEGVAADRNGNIFGAEVGPKRLMKYVKK